MFRVENVKVNEIIEMNQLEIPANQVVCIIGKSGSGKSTFLRLLNHLDSPDEGTIFYRGNDIQQMDPIELRRSITMVPQTPVMFPGTIKDNLQIGQRLSGLSTADEVTLQQALKRVSLHKSLDTPANDLSGGEKQRLALARATLLDADVFLLDEPSSALDSDTADDVIDAFIDFIKSENKSLIMITHDLELAGRVADVTIEMNSYSEIVS
ncbi:ATP-binding cassette domain-containing protein [Virgibacillus pantothenticus]|nr:ATP-binding cassette domain-containing protein [Virgibacillus sp. 19R1-5]MBU8568066.1 ATP-binding cassette domain-containing protein [Virgibacillus pantothenticus]MBU8602012.1 ATP-binding cassette domain-containing protein [Virgibacillus pantothenticus]MBU8636262.1 ATP-binding cassette domain-containing protein [Virgibacillus pantothenticus]MBU8643782.1 ATP-binding cassette domain-containing protein [Virgibacillus pantothenticus]